MRAWWGVRMPVPARLLACLWLCLCVWMSVCPPVSLCGERMWAGVCLLRASQPFLPVAYMATRVHMRLFFFC